MTIEYTENLCIGGEAIASASQSGYPPTFAFDGNPATYRRSTEVGNAVNGVSWIGYRFNSPKKIARIYYQQANSEGSSVSSIKIQASNNEVTWVDIFIVNVYPQSQYLDFNNNMAYRSWRILANSGTGTSTWSWNVGEIEMYEIIRLDKFLILSSSSEVESVDGQQIKSIQSQSEQDFINHGMNDISSADFKIKYTKKQYFINQSQLLGNGKTFTHQVEFDRYKINKFVL